MIQIKSILSFFCFGFLVLMFSACGDNQFSPYSELKGLRVLGIQAAQPELNLGGSTTLEALVSWTDQTTQNLTHEASACLDPGVSFGADPTCEGAPTQQTILASSALSLTSPNFSRIITLGTLNVASFLDATSFAGFSESTQYNGVPILLVYQVIASDGTRESVSKTILVSEDTKTTKNQNPTISSVSLDGVVLTLFPTTSGTLLPNTNSNEASNSYTVKNSDGTSIPLSEELLLTWFLSEGSIKSSRTLDSATNVFTVEPNETASSNKTLVLVIRDGRGGIDYLILN